MTFNGRLHEQYDENAVDRNLQPTVECHCLELLRADQGVCEVNQQGDRDGPAKHVVDCHGIGLIRGVGRCLAAVPRRRWPYMCSQATAYSALAPRKTTPINMKTTSIIALILQQKRRRRMQATCWA